MQRFSLITLVLAAIAIVAAGPLVAQTPCQQFGNGSGSIYLPPDCKYYSPAELHLIEDAAQRAVLMANPIHQYFLCKEQPGGSTAGCNQPGGSLGGDIETFTSELVLQINGTGPVAGYSRTLTLSNVAVEVHSGRQPPGTSQSFATDMVRIQGQLQSGDPDFAQLEIIGGTANGFPSPGHTSAILDTVDNVWTIDSQFEVGYEIRFVGATGGPLDGYSGVYSGTVHMQAFGEDSNPDATAP